MGKSARAFFGALCFRKKFWAPALCFPPDVLQWQKEGSGCGNERRYGCFGRAGGAFGGAAGAAAFFFKFSICRYKRERADEQYEEQDSIWNPFAPRMKEAQAFIRAHTASM